MKNINKLSIVLFVSALVSACGTTKNAGEMYAEHQGNKYEAEVELVEDSVSNVPDWFLDETPYDENGFYAVAKGKSTDMTMAMRIARIEAKAQLGGQVSELISSQEKLFAKSANGLAGKTMTATIESFIKESNVAGTRFDRKELSNEGNEYVFYVRAYLPVTAMAEAQRRADFAKDLELESQSAQTELMLRISRADKLKKQRQEAETKKIQANADLKAAQLVEKASL